MNKGVSCEKVFTFSEWVWYNGDGRYCMGVAKKGVNKLVLDFFGSDFGVKCLKVLVVVGVLLALLAIATHETHEEKHRKIR